MKLGTFIEFCCKGYRIENAHKPAGFRIGKVVKMNRDGVTVVLAPYKTRGPEARYSRRMHIRSDEIIKEVKEMRKHASIRKTQFGRKA